MKKYIITKKKQEAKDHRANGIAMLLALSYACPLLPSSCSSGTILYLDQNTKLPNSIFTRYNRLSSSICSTSSSSIGTRFLKRACERSS